MEREQLKKKFKKEYDVVKWDTIKEHLVRDAVIIVSPELNIVESAIEIAQDHIDVVSGWLKEKKIYKPDQAILNEWEKNPEKCFGFIIVQPYVLIQEVFQ